MPTAKSADGKFPKRVCGPNQPFFAPRAEERAERQATALPEEENIIVPVTGELPPDLEILDDQELAGYLEELVREDGRIDMHELQISTQKGVVYLEGALPSEPERQILLNLMTDVAGIQEIVDHLEIQRLAWERSDRSKPEDAQEILHSPRKRASIMSRRTIHRLRRIEKTSYHSAWKALAR
jgi:hypothetical protein